MSEKVWFITEASHGLGRAWTEAALARGDKVAACARTGSALADLSERYDPDLLPIDLDVRCEGDVQEAMRVAASTFGRIDVVVSHAIYAVFGTIEAIDRAHARAQFDTNFFGTLWVVRAALPYLRKQGGGHILIASSLVGSVTVPAACLYNAMKWALEGLAETLATEVAEFGIKVTLIEPDGHDTDWARSSSTRVTPVTASNGLRDRPKAAAPSSRSSVEPIAAAEAILHVVDAPSPPLRLFLGDRPPHAGQLQSARQLWQRRAKVLHDTQD